jgi:F-type H+-transporting ATPase subunit epsilon
MKDKSGAWRSAFISNGILEVRRHKAVLIIDTAEWPEEIDRERAEASAKAAKDNLADAMMKYEADAAKEKMRRAELRLKVANTKINEK